MFSPSRHTHPQMHVTTLVLLHYLREEKNDDAGFLREAALSLGEATHSKRGVVKYIPRRMNSAAAPAT